MKIFYNFFLLVSFSVPFDLLFYNNKKDIRIVSSFASRNNSHQSWLIACRKKITCK